MVLDYGGLLRALKDSCCAGFDEQAWYGTLFDYGQSKAGSAGDDDMLIPKIVADLVFPLARHALQVSHQIPCAFAVRLTSVIMLQLQL